MKIPEEIKEIMTTLNNSGYESFIVGGCVRDSLMNKKPEDWDLATNATPEKVQEIFNQKNFKCFYENSFGTVGVVLKENEKRDYDDIVEITTYRTEATYSNKRHPDQVSWAKTIEEDLARRDFTVNAVAVAVKGKETVFIDPYNGRKDIENKNIETVRVPKERFKEDALRIFRAVRFATTLNFNIEEKTMEAIVKNASWIKDISSERIRDELIKMISSERAADGIELLRETGLLKYIIPELIEGYQVSQNKHHIYDCYQHNVLALKYAAEKNFSKEVRLAALLHDVAKPRCKNGEGENSTFYNHEVVGAKMAKEILNRLKFPKKEIDLIVKLIRYHLFYYNVGEVTESSIRRLVRQVGKENMPKLLELRMCDRIGSGVPKAEPYKLRHLKYLIEKTSQDPVSVKMLNLSGQDVMDILKIEPSKKVGWILDSLMGMVLEDPSKNNSDFLIEKTKELGKLNNEDLKNKAEKTKKEIEKIETKKDEMTKKKYWVT